jgi:hypothetical protein
VICSVKVNGRTILGWPGETFKSMCQGPASVEAGEGVACGWGSGAVAFWLQPKVKAKPTVRIAQASQCGRMDKQFLRFRFNGSGRVRAPG